MVAVPDVCVGPVTMTGAVGLSIAPVCRRVVAIVETVAELLRPGSDLPGVLADAGPVDLLVVSGTDLADVDDSDVDSSRTDGRDVDGSDVDGSDDDWDGYRARIAAEVERLGLPGLQLHHLDLRPPLTGSAEPDLVAALSELVGFDPEPGVYCLGPDATEGARGTIAAAAQRIARIYGIPLLRYR